jgi:hypothetical protein
MRSLRTRRAPAEQSATTTTEQAPATRTERPVAGAGATALGARAAGGLFLALARLVRTAAGVAFLLIVLGIILFDLKANPGNSIVKGIHDAANWLAGPFNGLFSAHGARKTLSINWGIAAVVYLIGGGIVAAIVASPARAMRPFRRY